MIEGTSVFADPLACICVCVCVEVLVLFQLSVTQQEMMIMSQGIRYQTMIHFTSLLDMICFDREQNKQP